MVLTPTPQVCNPAINSAAGSLSTFKSLGVSCIADYRNWWANDQPAYVSAPSDSNYGRCLGW